MWPVIDNPASCEIRAVISFGHARNECFGSRIVNYAQFMEEFSLLHIVPTGSEAHPASYPGGGVFPRG
jgi:hypothetical protein